MVERKAILAIDLGTSGPKVALCDGTGRVLASHRGHVALQLLDDGGAEQDPKAWWEAIATASRAVMDERVVAPTDVAAVSVTAQWAGTVAVDQRGEALRPAILWMDTRGAELVRARMGGLLRVAGYRPDHLLRFVSRTGGAPSLAGKEPLSHIEWLRAHEPDVFAATHKFLEPKDYVNARLCGRMVASHDSIALHWVTDNRRIDAIAYDRGLLAAVGLRREQLPDLVRATDVIGDILPERAEELGIGPQAVVVGGTPDVQSATLGSGAVRDYDGHVYIGTSSWLTCHVPFKKTDLLHNMASLPSALPGRYFVANAQETAGACVDWYREAIAPTEGRDHFYTELRELAAVSPPGSNGVLFMPWLYGERCPIPDADVRGGFINVSLRTRRYDLARALLEGVAFNNRWLLGHVERFIGRRMPELRMIGGGAKSELWCQIHADVLRRPILQVEGPEHANARGAALVAALGLRWTRVDDIGPSVPVRRRFEPDPAAEAIYDELFAAYVRAFAALRPIYRRLRRSTPR